MANTIDLAICMLVIDKHADNAKTIVMHAHEYYPDCTMLVLDNTEHNNLELPDYCTVYKNTSDNKTTAYSRKVLLEHCTNEYIWFLDADDDILPYDLCSIEPGHDIYNFDCIVINKDFPEGKYGESDLPLWTHFIRTDILKNVQQHITEDDRFIYNEDVLLTKYAYAKTNDVCRITAALYINNASVGNSMTEDYSGDNKYKLEHCLKGRQTYLDIIHNRIKDVSIDYDNTIYFIAIMLRTEGLDNKEAMVKMLFDAGINTPEQYGDAYDNTCASLNNYARRESLYIINNLFDKPIRETVVTMYRAEHKDIIDSHGNTITILVHEWFEDVPFDYGELHR